MPSVEGKTASLGELFGNFRRGACKCRMASRSRPRHIEVSSARERSAERALRFGQQRGAIRMRNPAPERTTQILPQPGKDNPKLRTLLRLLVAGGGATIAFALSQRSSRTTETAGAIRQAAERFNADVICLGSHGRSGLAKSLSRLGSARCHDGSQRPVLVVREEIL